VRLHVLNHCQVAGSGGTVGIKMAWEQEGENIKK
jgi:hypothetical protein